jgi:glycosyltransferase involved in cell wall biosynthesis
MTKRLLWHSNAPWASTGYAGQTALFTPRLAEHYELAVSAFYGLEGSPLAYGNFQVLPGLGGSFGNEAIEGHAERWFGSLRGGLVVTLMDVWVLDPRIWKKLNVACWCPVDHDPAPPRVHNFFNRSGVVPIAMSKFGQERLPDALYCPHAVDTEVYKPYDRAESRKGGLPESAFVVGVVAANKGNPPRKSFPEIMQAFAAFRKRHDDVLLYLHTEITGMHDGVEIPKLVEAFNIPPESVFYADQYRQMYDPLPHDSMARLYSSMDVLVNISKGEGFGLPIIEAQSCGTPVIVTDFSAMPELVGGGWLVEYEREWSPQGLNPLGIVAAWHAKPSIEDTVEALESAYRMSAEDRRQTAERSRKHALKYDIETVMEEHMLPTLEKAAERYEDRKPMKLAVAA